MTTSNANRYKYDSYIQSEISSILYVNGEVSSNQLRRGIQEMVSEEKNRMRKTRRKKDKNIGYTPSGSKVTATINQLLEWNWIERRESNHKDYYEGKAILTNPIPKVFYSLSEDARFAIDIGIGPHEDFHLEDAFHAVVSSAAIGWDYYEWDEKLRMGNIVNIEGTSIEDIKNRRHHLYTTIGKFPRFSKLEIQRAIEIALIKEIIQKKVIGNDVKYVIVENLSKFVRFCWRSLFRSTMELVQHMFLIKRLSNKSEEYKVIFSWLSRFYSTKSIKDRIITHNANRRTFYKEEHKENLKVVKDQLDEVVSLKKEAFIIYEKSIGSTNIRKFKDLKEAVIRYVCPEDVLDAVRKIVSSL